MAFKVANSLVIIEAAFVLLHKSMGEDNMEFTSKADCGDSVPNTDARLPVQVSLPLLDTKTLRHPGH